MAPLSGGRIGTVELIPTNTAIFAPRGFRPVVPDAARMAEVTAGSVWGSGDVARLRTAGLVRVLPAAPLPPDGGPPPAGLGNAPGTALRPDDLALRTVLWLALAGVPVTSEGLDTAVRERLDPHLLELMDGVRPASVADAVARELLSLQLRRRARALVGHHPAEAAAVVAVLLPGGGLPPGLRHDLEAQTWPAVVRCPVQEDESAADTLDRARQDGALYCTRMDPGLRYGPHHLADLVDALRHSGARVAHSPLRFRPWREGSWLEDELRGVEGPAAEGLPGGSLWYAVDGTEAPAGRDGYAVHGSNAVPAAAPAQGRAVALRLHAGRPALLDWLPEDVAQAPAGQASHDPAPPSYFAATRAPSRARSAVTASES